MKRFLIAATTAVAVAAGGIGVAQANSSTPTHHGRGNQPVAVNYVALGDSYTAAPFVPVMDPANGCYRSSNNYPHQLAASINIASFVDASCSGAQTKDAYLPQGPGIEAQLNAVNSKTNLVTISLGGNDEDLFGNLLTYCIGLGQKDPAGTPCTTYFKSLGDKTPERILRRTTYKLALLISIVRAKAAPGARIVVVGYPVLVPEQGTCAALPFAAGDYAYARKVNVGLSEAAKKAARLAHAEYVDVARASKGHDICSTDPWVNGPVTDPTRAQSFHPFLNEQTAIADLVRDQLRRRHPKMA